MKYQIILMGLLVACFLSSSRCNKKCQKGDGRTNLDIADTIKKTILKFPQNTRWIFKSATGDMDTVYLGQVIYSYDDGNCVHDDCCETQYVQSAIQLFNYTVDSDGLKKFYQFQFTQGAHWILSPSFNFSISYNFLTYYQTSMSINSVMLNDISYRIQPGITKGDIYIDAVYWSLSKGLVRYDYQQTDGSYISYERQDI